MKVTLAATQMKCTWEIENNIEKAKQLISIKQQKRGNKKGGKSLTDTVQALHSEILNLERRRETTEMPISKEREVMEKLGILRRSLGEQESELATQEHLNLEVSELDAEIDSEFSKAMMSIMKL